LKIQLAVHVIVMPRAEKLGGKISAVMSQGMGPKPNSKKVTKANTAKTAV
jgi:hypothetical protein